MSEVLLFIFSSWLEMLSGLGLQYVVPQLHSDSHNQYDLPGRMIVPSQDPLPDHAQHSQKPDIRFRGGIRNHFETTFPANEWLQTPLRQPDHRDQLTVRYLL
jgi:hypothetical protein